VDEERGKIQEVRAPDSLFDVLTCRYDQLGISKTSSFLFWQDFMEDSMVDSLCNVVVDEVEVAIDQRWWDMSSVSKSCDCAPKRTRNPFGAPGTTWREHVKSPRYNFKWPSCAHCILRDSEKMVDGIGDGEDSRGCRRCTHVIATPINHLNLQVWEGMLQIER
jgi:hypothetical protein